MSEIVNWPSSTSRVRSQATVSSFIESCGWPVRCSACVLLQPSVKTLDPLVNVTKRRYITCTNHVAQSVMNFQPSNTFCIKTLSNFITACTSQVDNAKLSIFEPNFHKLRKMLSNWVWQKILCLRILHKHSLQVSYLVAIFLEIEAVWPYFWNVPRRSFQNLVLIFIAQ